MRKLLRWGPLMAVLGAVLVWFRRRQDGRADFESLGPVSSEWFMDHRHEL
jgi:hypothetical protein